MRCLSSDQAMVPIEMRFKPSKWLWPMWSWRNSSMAFRFMVTFRSSALLKCYCMLLYNNMQGVNDHCRLAIQGNGKALLYLNLTKESLAICQFLSWICLGLYNAKCHCYTVHSAHEFSMPPIRGLNVQELQSPLAESEWSHALARSRQGSAALSKARPCPILRYETAKATGRASKARHSAKETSASSSLSVATKTKID